MKYVLFTAAVLGILPATLFILMDRRWLRWAVCALAVLILVFQETAINFFSHEDYRGTSRGLEVSLIYLVALVVLLVLTFSKGFRSPFPDLGSKLYAVYFLLSLPSIMNAENALYSVFEVWKMIMVWLVFLAASRYLRETGDFDAILYGIGAVTLVNFLVIVRQHIGGIYQVNGVFPHQNSMAMFMTATGALFFARFFSASRGWKRWFAFAVFAAASISLVRTYSRGALICYPFACMIVAAASLRYEFRMRKIRILIPIVLLCLFGFGLFLPRVVERFESAPKSSGETRKNFAIAAMNMIRDKPLFGVGLNNWGIKINPPYEYSRHRDPAKGYSEDFKDGIVETIYLLVGAECGIPALLALLAWFGSYLALAFRILRPLSGTELFFIPAGMLGGLAGAYLQSALEWVLKQQVNFIELMLLFALLGWAGAEAKKIRGNPKIREKAMEAAA